MNTEVINFESLYTSMYKCKKGVIWKDSTTSFVLNGLENIIKLESQLYRNEYKPRKPYSFKITSPKPREIISVGFRDRIYQRTLNDLLVYPNAIKSFIYDNAACQKGKGTDFARDRLKLFLRKAYRLFGNEFYVLQCDISGYYPNMKHSVVSDKFAKFLDKDTHLRCMNILERQYDGDVGFNAGSQMVQIAGISVLDNLDHFIKEKLRVKFYIRYMDDFIILGNDRGKLQEYKSVIEKELDKIGFKFNEKKTKIFQIGKGLLFLGFIFRVTKSGKIIMLIDPQNVKRERKKLFRLVKLAKNGKIPKSKVYECFTSWKAHASKGNSFKLINRMNAYLKSLWRG